MPARLVKSILRDPSRRTTPAAGRRFQSAILSASKTSVVCGNAPIAQPTTRRLNTSSTTAKYSQPAPVRTYVMSATQRRFGAGVVNWRRTRSGAGAASLGAILTN